MTDAAKLSLATLLADYETVNCERIEHEDGSVSYQLSIESPSNSDLLGMTISLPDEVVEKYDLRMWNRDGTPDKSKN
jgi:hypothetical protein